MSFLAGSVRGNIIMDNAQFNKAMGQVNSAVDKASAKMRQAGIAVTALGGAITMMSSRLYKVSAEQEAIFARLEQAVENAGISYDQNAEHISRFLAEVQKLTVYGDTETADVLKTMLMFTDDLGKAMEGTRVAMDMAAQGEFKLASAQRYVGMALSGNVEMLGRYIAEFKVANNEQLKSMDSAEKTAYALEELRGIFGGMAAKELSTASGHLRQMKNYLGDLKEAIGDALLPMVRKYSQAMTDMIPRAIEWVNVHKSMTTVVVQLTTALGALMLVLGPLLLMGPNLIKFAIGLSTALVSIGTALGAGGGLAAGAVGGGIVAVITLFVGALAKAGISMAAARSEATRLKASLDDLANRTRETMEDWVEMARTSVEARNALDLYNRATDNLRAAEEKLRTFTEGTVLERKKLMREYGAWFIWQMRSQLEEEVAVNEKALAVAKDKFRKIGQEAADAAAEQQKFADRVRAAIDMMNKYRMDNVRKELDFLSGADYMTRLDKLQYLEQVMANLRARVDEDMATIAEDFNMTTEELYEFGWVGTKAIQDVREEMDRLQRARPDVFLQTISAIKEKYENMPRGLLEQFTHAAGGMESAMANAFDSMMARTQSFGDGFKQMVVDIQSAFRRAIAEMIAELIKLAIMKAVLTGAKAAFSGLDWGKTSPTSGTDGVTVEQAPSAATGMAFVPETGLYALHRGESVVPAARTKETSDGGKEQPITIVNTIDQESLFRTMATSQGRRVIANTIAFDMKNNKQTRHAIQRGR